MVGLADEVKPADQRGRWRRPRLGFAWGSAHLDALTLTLSPAGRGNYWGVPCGEREILRVRERPEERTFS